MALHRYLDGDPSAPQPFDWWLSRVCEEFHCLPDAALIAHGRLPVGTIERIIEARAYAATMQLLKDGKVKDLPDTDLTALAQEIEFQLVREERDAITGARHG